jgi:16S rRNA (uracil1498-N3)-methyltransferase
VALEENAAHYLGRVLRVTAGQAVVLFNGDGHDYAAEILRVGRRELALAVNSRLPGLAESALELVVVQALSRGERMDQTLQKCTELGAAAFRLLVSARSELRLSGEKLQRRLEHWQSVVISACEQCGRARVPQVWAPLTLPDWLDQAAGGSCSRVVLDPTASTPLALARLGPKVELAVGPEGGFDEREVELMRARGVQAVSLGPRVLRTETAAPAAVAILQCLQGDLGSGGPQSAAGGPGSEAPRVS